MADVTSTVDEVAVGRYARLLSKRVKITAAQVLALNGTPVELVAAPGADKMLEFVSAVIHKPAGTAYADIHLDDEFLIQLRTTAVSLELEATGFMDQVTAQTRAIKPIASHYTPVANTALNLTMDNSEITTGNSDLYVTIVYLEYQNVVDNPAT